MLPSNRKNASARCNWLLVEKIENLLQICVNEFANLRKFAFEAYN